MCLIAKLGSRVQRISWGCTVIGRRGRAEWALAEAGLPLQIALRPCTAAGKQSTPQLLQARDRTLEPVWRLEHRPEPIGFEAGNVPPMAVDAVHLRPERAGHQT